MFKRYFNNTASAIAAAMVLSSAGAVLAADLPPPPPPPIEIRDAVYDWSGAYIGVNAGLGFGDSTYIPSGSPDPDLAGDGYLIGGYAGYNYQMSNFVMGIEGDVSFGEVNPENTIDQVEQDVDLFASIRARLGYAHGRTLAYLTGGVAWADSEIYLPQFDASESKTHFGYVVGGGLEHAWTDNFVGRIEYLFADLGSKDYDFPQACATCTIDLDMDDFHIVRAGAAWKF